MLGGVVTATELAIPVTALSAEDAAGWPPGCARVRDTCAPARWLRPWTPNRAEIVREWARAYRAATVVALEACRLQATALRRLGQLNPELARKGQERNCRRVAGRDVRW